MFETIFDTTPISTGDTFISIGITLILGLVISLVYLFSDRKKRTSQHFSFALVILPAIVAMVIMLVGSDIAKAISLGGVFTLVRFRSVPGDSKDITNVFFAMAAGLACGMGYVKLGVCFTVLICVIYFVFMRFGYGERKNTTKQLKITIPEDFNYQGAFDDLFKEYSNNVELEKVKTTNLGTLYELTYSIELKNDINEKQFIDSIRCRNGNLNITLTKEESPAELL